MTSKDGFSVVAPMRMIAPRFDVGEEGVLLRFVEAVDLVDEDDGPPALGQEEPARLLHQFLDLGDFGQYGAERDEGVPCLAFDDPGQRRLAGAGRPQRIQEL